MDQSVENFLSRPALAWLDLSQSFHTKLPGNDNICHRPTAHIGTQLLVVAACDANHGILPSAVILSFSPARNNAYLKTWRCKGAKCMARAMDE